MPVNLNTAPAAARGYSMAEVLATVAIILILGSLVVMNVVSLQANLRQKELDAKAEIIYTAAQEQMTRLMASGREYVLTPDEFLPSQNESTDPASLALAAVSSTGNSRPKVIPETPGDVEQAAFESETQLCYISSADKTPGSVAYTLLGNGTLDDELFSNDWVIEYDYRTLTVHAVYYSESKFNEDSFSLPQSYEELYSGAYRFELRNFANRMDCSDLIGNNHVGYHGGGSAISRSSYRLSPTIEVKNEEKLTATIKCTSPSISENLVFAVTLSDEFGNKRKSFYVLDDEYQVADHDYYLYKGDITGTFGGPHASEALYKSASLTRMGVDYVLNLTFDDLSSPSSRFAVLYGGKGENDVAAFAAESGNDYLVIGSKIKVQVEVACPSNPKVATGYAGSTISNPCEFNSLFDNMTDSSDKGAVVAGISCGRHLQNLDKSSHVNSNVDTFKVTKAVQHADIDFSAAGDEENAGSGWASSYDKGSFFNGQLDDSSSVASFKPIANTVLTSYDGMPSGAQKPYRIAGLSTSGSKVPIEISESGRDGQAGLFGQITTSMEFKNIAVVDARIGAGQSGSAGGLASSVADGGSVTVTNCQVYLDRPEKSGTNVRPSAWITGASAGGLIGAAGDNSVTIAGSSASTVVEALGSNGHAGGLVGSAGSGTIVGASYADCYIYGFGDNARAGGLACGDVGSVAGSYSAGFIAAKKGAGLVYGTPVSVESVYTVCAKLIVDDLSNATYYVTSSSAPGAYDRLYYLNTSTSSSETAYGTSFDGADTPAGIAKKADDLKGFLDTEDTFFTLAHKDLSKPYNLMDQGLVSYPWPTIEYPGTPPAGSSAAPLVHYGDWTSGFQSGSLVYYEAYKEGGVETYGFYGAGVPSTLKDTNNVIGDGYAVVVRESETPSFTVNITNPEASNPTQTLISQIIDENSPYFLTNGYKLYPLRALIVSDTDPGAASISNTSNVNGASFYLAAEVGSSRYFFNPHFANTVREAAEGAKPTSPAVSRDQISIRTSRHLYNLSKFYQQYRECTRNCTFKQNRKMKYSTYEWETFYKAETPREGQSVAEASRIKEQGPIGTGIDESFVGTYDGGRYRIEDVGFVGDNGKDYLGMFGYVARSSTLQDIVLCTDYNSDPNAVNYCVRRTEAARANRTVYMGVLAGYNAGAITNCAVAGYYLDGMEGTVQALANSAVYAGGLVGGNIGAIMDCSADCPKLRLSQYLAKVSAGGFVGINRSSSTAEGDIKNCYALGAIELVDARGGSTLIGGFAGTNRGSIVSSYCAVPVISTGETTHVYGFAPTGGYVSKCKYLNGVTYSYVSNMYAFNFDTNGKTHAGTPVKFDDLAVQPSASNAVSSDNSHVHSETVSSSGRYPFAGKVRNKNGDYVHYGNWLDDAVLGTLGVFYWEHEIGGRNDGYRMTHIGTEENTTSPSGAGATPQPKLVAGSSLCTSHSDEGVITEYGYGYYVQRGQEGAVIANWEDVACSSPDNQVSAVISRSQYNTAASEELQKELIGSDRLYTFVAFTTSADESRSDYLYLDGEASKPNGKLKLYYQNSNGETVRYTFEVSPFFANALSIDSYSYAGEAGTLDESLYVKASDGGVTNYREEPGIGSSDVTNHDKNSYEIRSVQQLQYINWSAERKNTDTLVPAARDDNTAYPYLQYSPDSGETNQIRKTAEDARPARFWLQTHDIDGNGVWNDPSAATSAALNGTQPAQATLFSPIAGSATSSSTRGQYNAKIYAWFGGHYDGQSYTVKDVAVSSKSFNVGLFGVTAGAELKNIIMQGSNGNAVIERSLEWTKGAYSLGGLVGLAYAYAGELSSSSANLPENTIVNCAISDYVIRDSSTGEQTGGEACIGGLIGVAKVDLNQCSAVVSIELNCKPENFDSPGNYIRVGGLVGGLRYSCKNSYSGGSITVNNESLLAQTYTLQKKELHEGDYAEKYRSTHIYLAGIAGCSFSPKFVNFGDPQDSSMKISNCYTFMRFPEMRGTIRGITMIASVADRYDTGFKEPVIKNCYYLDTCDDFKTDNLPDYVFALDKNQQKKRNKPLAEILESRPEEDGPTEKELMIKGDFNYLKAYYEGYEDKGVDYNWKRKRYTLDVNAISYEDMSKVVDGKLAFATTLNTGYSAEKTTVWDAVTTVDAVGGNIDGKYSFPSNKAYEGKNYPFPTVITQNDLTFGKVDKPVPVHVHYGNWPSNGSYWENGRDTLDIFKQMQDDSYAYKTFVLHLDTSKNFSASSLQSRFSVDEGGRYASIHSAEYDSASNTVKVTVKALKPGATVITYRNADGSDVASFTLEVTANWRIAATYEGADTSVFDASTNRLKVTRSFDKPEVLALHAQTPVVNAEGQTEYQDILESGQISWDSCTTSNKFVGAKLTDGLSPSLEVTRFERGLSTVTVTATYHYHGVALEQQLIVTVVEPGVVGLTNGTVFNEVQLGEADKGSKDVEYREENQPSYDMTKGHNFALYVSAGESMLDDLKDIGEIYIIDGANRHQCENGSYKADDPYYVRIEAKGAASGQYAYLGGVVSHNKAGQEGEFGEGALGKVAIEITLKGGYTLKVDLNKSAIMQTQTIKYTFKPGWAGDSHAAPFDVVKGSTFTFEDPTKSVSYGFSQRPKYEFKDWKSGGEYYAAGQSATVVQAQDTEFVAQWRKMFDVNLNWGHYDPQKFTVFNGDASVDLSAYRVRKAAEEAAVKNRFFTIEGWYTSTDGTGVKVLNADGTVVDGKRIGSWVADGVFHFDESNEAENVLYAKWVRGNIWVKASALDPNDDSQAATKFIIASRTDSGYAQIAGMDDPDTLKDAYTEKSTAAEKLRGKLPVIKSDSIEVFKDSSLFSNTPYLVSAENIPEEYWWWATTITTSTTTGEGESAVVTSKDRTGIKNYKYCNYFLVDNDCNYLRSGKYAMVVRDSVDNLTEWEGQDPYDRAGFQLDGGSKALRTIIKNSKIGFAVVESQPILHVNGSSESYLYVEKFRQCSTFDYDVVVNEDDGVSSQSEGEGSGSSKSTLGLLSTLFSKPDDELLSDE